MGIVEAVGIARTFGSVEIAGIARGCNGDEDGIAVNFVRVVRVVVMAHSFPDWTSRLRCSYKSATFILCTGNVLMALFMLHAALSPVYYFESASSPGVSSSSFSTSVDLDGRLVQTQEELERIEDSNRLRRELLPFHLIERVREIQEETELEIQKAEALNLARQKVAAELSERLRELKLSNSESTQKGGEEKAVDSRIEILGENLQQHSNGASTEKVDTAVLDTIIPGRAMPPECHAEANTDYGGAAVRWGLTHHVDSAADCCQACLDQAKSATTEGEKKMKCNIWVYCPSEGGCYSPDKYTHKNHECWLKQANDPVINFKGHYNEEFRQQHPTAPSIVPWVSGVVS